MYLKEIICFLHKGNLSSNYTKYAMHFAYVEDTKSQKYRFSGQE